MFFVVTKKLIRRDVEIFLHEVHLSGTACSITFDEIFFSIDEIPLKPDLPIYFSPREAMGFFLL